MANIQVRATLKAANGLAKDNCINTFAVMGATPGSDDIEIADAFADFYISAPTGHGGDNAAGIYINSSIARTNGLLIELVESPQTPPNVPYYAHNYTLPNPGGTANMPQECAIAVSTQTYFPSALHPARSRGRFYFGPLITNCMTTVANVCRPVTGVLDDLCASAAELKDAVEVGEAPISRAWAVWSRVDSTFVAIGSGWVDDEFDTQRRRGRERTGRALWG